jgi:hypothetical protein
MNTQDAFGPARREPDRPRGGLRGARISQVLSEARASLKEPSRPFTPASLDERAQNSLDGALSRALDREISRTSSAASTSGSSSRRGSSSAPDIWVNDAFDHGENSFLTMSTVPLGDDQSFSGSTVASTGASSHGGAYSLNEKLVQNLRGSLVSSRDFSLGDTDSVFQIPGTSAGAGTGTGAGVGSGFDSEEWGEGDAEDMMNEFNSGGYGSGGYGSTVTSGDERPSEDESTGSLSLMLCDLNDAASTLDADLGTSLYGEALSQVLGGMTHPIDRLAKYIRRPALAKASGSTADDIDSTRKCLSRVLLRVIPVPKDSAAVVANSRALACRHLLRLHLAQLQFEGSTRGGAAGIAGGKSSSSSRGSSSDSLRGLLRVTRTLYEMSTGGKKQTKDKESQREEASEDLVSSGNAAMLEGGLQLLLDLLAHTWDTLQAEAVALSGSASQQSSASTSAVTSHPLAVLLESAVFAGGVLRLYSNEATNRKRLLHLGAVEALAKGFKVSVMVSQLVRVGASAGTGIGGGEAPTASSASTSSLYRHIMEQVARVTEQLVGAQRNFTQDSAGRARSLKARSVGSLCALLIPFRGQAELVLNVARIAAKLSLLDTFRSQINAKTEHVRSLVELIVREADRCRSVMEGSGSGGGAAAGAKGDADTWPQWHTWPLLSRVSFTLGNLTTSNDQNRELIGVSCSCIKPLIVLLQACACSLTVLHSGENTFFDEEDEEEEDEEGVACDEFSLQRAADDNSFEAEEEGKVLPASPGGDNLDQRYNRTGHSGSVRKNPAEQELTDATVKLLRLLANLCIDTSVGSAVAARMDACEMLNELLVCCNSNITDEQGGQHEELLLNVVATCTNVTYYACHKQAGPASADSMSKRQQSALLAMSTHLSQCLFHANAEVVLETARALGNLTRLPTVLQSLAQTRTDEALILLLSHKDMDVVSAVTGALINLSASPKSRPLLMQDGRAMGALVSALRRSSLRNLSTSTLICQAFHNLIAATKSAEEVSSGTQRSLNSALNPPGLSETLEELVDLAAELTSGADQYSALVNVGRAVQKLLGN